MSQSKESIQARNSYPGSKGSCKPQPVIWYVDRNIILYIHVCKFRRLHAYLKHFSMTVHVLNDTNQRMKVVVCDKN